jgi:hypothetical protein
MSNDIAAAAFDAALAAEEAARWAEPAAATQTETPTEPVEKPVQADPPDKATDLTAEPVEPAVEPSAEELAAIAAEEEESSVATRIKKAHIEAREAKKRAKLLEQELEVLRGTRTETRDETVRREAEQLATQMASSKAFNDDCAKVAEQGKKEFKDFPDVINSLWETLGGFNQPLVEAALEAGEAHKTLIFLGNNPDEAERIAALPPARQGAAIARIATQLAAPKIKKVSNAPAPIAPVSGGATGGETQEPDLDKMSMAQAAKYWDKKDRERRAARFE